MLISFGFPCDMPIGTQAANEQDFIRRAAAWRIRSVELNRWIQAQAVGE
jgi:hypothetical protein